MEFPSRALVTDLLRARMDPSLECEAIERGPLGNAQETWFVEARGAGGARRRLVVRRSAGAGTLEHTDRGLEFALLGTLAARAFPVPRVHWLETDPSSLGRPYFVMDRLPGTALAHATPDQRPAIARELGAWLAKLHALDPRDVAPQLPAPDGAARATRAEVARWTARYLRSRPGPVPLLGALLAWLDAHVPATDAPVRLLWGDAGPHNLLVRDGRITGLLDWELAHVGDPLEDLGAAVWACLPDTLAAEEVVAGYEAETGPIDHDRLRYHEALACGTRSVMVVAGVAAFLGGSAGPAAAALGQHLLLHNLARATALAGWEAEAAEPVSPPVLRPDVRETAAGVARYLREAVLPALSEPRVRRETKTAAALLDTAAHRAPEVRPGDDAALEEAAVLAERERAPERRELRGRLLAGLAAQQEAVRPLERLYRRGG